MEVDYEKLFARSKAFGQKKGLDEIEAEDFAQECLIRSLKSKEGIIKLEYVFADYRGFHRADKRLLSSPEGQLSAFRTRSLDAPIDSAQDDSAKLGDFIADPRGELDDSGIIGELSELLEALFERVKQKRARRWAYSVYSHWLEDNL
jgi:hypothetical protein